MHERSETVLPEERTATRRTSGVRGDGTTGEVPRPGDGDTVRYRGGVRFH